MQKRFQAISSTVNGDGKWTAEQNGDTSPSRRVEKLTRKARENMKGKGRKGKKKETFNQGLSADYILISFVFLLVSG